MITSKRVVTLERQGTATEVVERSAGEIERSALTELQAILRKKLQALGKVEGHKRRQREREMKKEGIIPCQSHQAYQEAAWPKVDSPIDTNNNLLSALTVTLRETTPWVHVTC